MTEEDRNKNLTNSWEDYTYSIGKFDDQSLLISSGALGLSLTFIKEIVPLKTAIYLGLFYCAITLFLMTIILGFFNHWYSAMTSSHIHEKLNKKEDEKKIESYRNNRWALIGRLNTILGTSLLFGLLLLVIFCLINIHYYRILPEKAESNNSINIIRNDKR